MSNDNNHGHLIFVSIAAYRDPQLVPTIEDCIVKAAHPERLRFGICWQHDPTEDTLPFRSDDCFRILAIDWRDSKGACWARAEIMKLWRGEPWFLQVDSHCRFAPDWDTKLIEAMALTASEKPILSTYASPFTPGENELLVDGPLQMALQGFTPEGIPHMKPIAIPNWQRLTRPRRARFLSAGFLFAPGSFVEELGYDPELYFLGEEAAITVRAFTHGYDLFHPHQTLIWHDYGRPNAPKHWGDHIETNNVRRQWHDLDAHSRQKVKKLLTGQPVENFGLGSARTLQQYQDYAGLSFLLGKAQEYTVRSEEPPNPPADPDWAGQIFSWMVRIYLQRDALPAAALTDPEFWVVAVNDESGTEIYRTDVPQAQLSPLLDEQAPLVLFCEFESATVPARWSVWPVSQSQGWLRKLEAALGPEDFTIVLEEAPL
ncbi:MAG: UDP-N-acetylglucosamine-transferase [Acidobacteriota bacterium]|nr:UDP-N-acetylglucosamine-transferase [Acidobacteriota bacterium]